MPEYRCSNCHQPTTTPTLCSVGVSGDCCLEAQLEVLDGEPHDWKSSRDGWGVVFGVSRCKTCEVVATKERMEQLCDGIYRSLTAFEEDELKRDLFDGLPRAQRRSIERSNES